MLFLRGIKTSNYRRGFPTSNKVRSNKTFIVEFRKNFSFNLIFPNTFFVSLFLLVFLLVLVLSEYTGNV